MFPRTHSWKHTCANPETVDVYWNSNFNRTDASSYQLTGWIVVLLPELSIKSGLHVCEARRNHKDRNLPFVRGNTTWPLATLVSMCNKLLYVWGVVSWKWLSWLEGFSLMRFFLLEWWDSSGFSLFFFIVMCVCFGLKWLLWIFLCYVIKLL